MSRQGCRDNYPEDFDEGEGRVEGRGDLLSTGREKRNRKQVREEREGRDLYSRPAWLVPCGIEVTLLRRRRLHTLGRTSQRAGDTVGQ